MVWLSFDEHVFRYIKIVLHSYIIPYSIMDINLYLIFLFVSFLSYPWAEVVQAALQKYPNPETPNVSSTDIIARKVDSDGKLRSQKIIASYWRNMGTDIVRRVRLIIYITYTKLTY